LTEVPEHLLRRSRERREALGLGGGEGGGESAPAAPAPAAASETAPAEAAPAAPAAAEPVPPPEPEPAPPPPPYVQAAYERSRIPVWAMPVLIVLPLWALLYASTLDTSEEAASGILEQGAQLYSANCATCHGGSGGGGVGPQLSNGEVVLTFPEAEDQLKFVTEGSQAIKGEEYGDPDREGGAHVAETGQMPAWGDVLSPEEIQAVVTHERVVFGGEEPPPEGAAGAEGGGGETGPADAGGGEDSGGSGGSGGG
jgi:mono/diheme cytochrome c family protein